MLLGACSGVGTLAPVSSPTSTPDQAPHALPPDALDTHFAHWQGTPYAFGGTTRAGVDCSGFVRRTFARVYGVALPRTTRGQRLAGQEIPRAQMRRGDLVFFSIDDENSHVGIYDGAGHFIHASTRRGVVRSRLDSRYWSRRYSASVRVLATADGAATPSI